MCQGNGVIMLLLAMFKAMRNLESMTSIQSSPQSYSAATLSPARQMSRAMYTPQSFGAINIPKTFPKISFFSKLKAQLNQIMVDILGMKWPLLLRKKFNG